MGLGVTMGLTASKVERGTKPGRYGDGAGLYLLVRSKEAKVWLVRYTRDGKMREMRLGPAVGRTAVGLSEARAKVRELHVAVAEGRDPRAPEQSSVTPLSGLTWPSSTITWAFGTPSSTSGLGLGTITKAIIGLPQQKAVMTGIERWPRVGSLEIVHVSDPQKAMVEIGYADVASLQLLGRSVWRYQPETKKFKKFVIELQDPGISPLSKGTDGALTYRNGVELQQLVAHEFGVALGLAEGPGTDGCSVMNHVLTSANRTPDPADIAALRKIYAASSQVAQPLTPQPSQPSTQPLALRHNPHSLKRGQQPRRPRRSPSKS